MTDSSDLQHSVQAMGFAELGLAFAALGCYCMVLNGALSARSRAIAAACAALAASGFTALTQPWTNGVILVALGVASIGIFVAAAWALSAVCRLTAQPVRAVEPALVSIEDAPQGNTASLPRPGAHAPVHPA
jgi:hypothetical protein